jgi:uncharacterized repeat protein (TIGR02543 family)
MDNIFRKIVIMCLSVVLIGGVIFGVVYIVNNARAIFFSGKLYTSEEIDNAYLDGYNVGISNYENLLKEIDILRDSVVGYVAQLQEYEVLLDNTTEALLNSQLSEQSKQNLIYELENNVYNLSVYINELDTMILTLQNENILLLEQVDELEKQKTALLNTIYAYEQLVESLRQEIFEQRFGLTFYFDDTVLGLILVPYNTGEILQGDLEYLQSQVLQRVNELGGSEYCIFNGWSVEPGGVLIDLTVYEVTADTQFYANLTRKYDVNFIKEGQNLSHQIITKGSVVNSIPSVSSTDRKLFKGWSLDGTTVVSPATYAIYINTNFFAVMENKYFVSWKVNDTTYSSAFVSQGAIISKPANPSKTGYEFSHWTLNNQTVTDFNISVQGDMTFVAHFTAVLMTNTSTTVYDVMNASTYWSTFDLLSFVGITDMAGATIDSFSVNFTVFTSDNNGNSVELTYTLSNDTLSISDLYDKDEEYLLWWVTNTKKSYCSATIGNGTSSLVLNVRCHFADNNESWFWGNKIRINSCSVLLSGV